MAGFSDYLENKVLNWLRGTSMGTAPAALYVGLFSAAPTDAGGGTEITNTIRSGGRVATTFGAPASGSMSNDTVIDYGNAEGAGAVTHFGIFDAASGGNLLGYGATPATVNIAQGNAVSFAVGALSISLE